MSRITYLATLCWALSSGCDRSDEVACVGFDVDETVTPSDSSAGFSAEDVVDALGTRSFDVAFDEGFLTPSFGSANVSWSLGSHDVYRGRQPDSECSGEGTEGLAIPVVVDLTSDDETVSVAKERYVFATGPADADLAWAWAPAFSLEDPVERAIVPTEYLDFAVEQAGGTFDDATPTVVVNEEVAVPGFNLDYQGTTPEGSKGITVFRTSLTPR